MAIDQKLLFERINYTPHPKQWLYHNSGARFRLPCCGRRFGKSTMAARDLEPKLFDRKRRFWIVGPTYDLGEKEFRVLWDDLIVGQGLGRDKRVRKAYNKKQGEMYIEFPWQTRVEVRSADHPASLVGEALDGVIMSEAAKHRKETFERYIRPALADRRGFADFPTTPEGHNWLYDMWLLGLDPNLGDYASWRFPSWENPAVYPGGRDDPEIKLLEQTTTSEWFLQEIGADFASFVGKIYPEFDETTHVKPIQYHPEWANYITFDWGFINPLAAIEFMVDGSDNVYVWREHYKSYTILQDHISQLRNREQPPGYHLDGTFGDAEDPEASAYVSSYFCYNWSLPEAKANWRQGIDLVKQFLKPRDTGVKLDEYGTPEIKPKLFVDPSCTNLIKEFTNYRAKKTARGVTSPREIAEKIDDHALDALRYGLVHLFELGCKHHLVETYAPVNDSGLIVVEREPGYYEEVHDNAETMFSMDRMRF